MQIHLHAKNLLRRYNLRHPIPGQFIFRQYIPLLHNARTIPTPAILCIAAILGCISIVLAFNTMHPSDNSNHNSASQVIMIIPASAQKQVALSLPE